MPRSATPCSVTTYWTWWRGVVTGVPAGSCGDDGRDALAARPVAVERRQMMLLPLGAVVRADDEQLVPADAGVLPRADGVGHDLAAQVDRDRAVDAHHAAVARG